jgi:hypothetical protein
MLMEDALYRFQTVLEGAQFTSRMRGCEFWKSFRLAILSEITFRHAQWY